VLAVAAVGTVAVLATQGGEEGTSKVPKASVPAADMSCVRSWNEGTSVSTAELRVTLGQFTGALGRIGRVDPLPGTLMGKHPCALTVYDRGTGAHAIFVSGVKDHPGYMDVTSYPRAARYGWPKTADEANVRIQPDGGIRALDR
jgi:hypothetical protein